MANLKSIRLRLGVTQHALAEAMGCVQGNIPFYEKGREIPVSKAKRLIAFAQMRGLALTLEHVYGDTPLPVISDGDHPNAAWDVPRMQVAGALVEAKAA